MPSDRGQPAVTLDPGGLMPLVGLGTWQMTGARCQAAVRAALEVGYRHKRRTLDTSLRALGMAYVDLWLVHWPPRGRALISTWKELLAARDQGLARAVGVSNYSPAQLDQLTAATGQVPQVNQIPWAPALYDPALLEGHRWREVALEGYSPFKNTDLRHPVLTEIAARHRVTPAQVVVRWHVDHQVVVIPKSANHQRIATNFDIVGFSLTSEELGRIDRLSATPRR